MVSTDRAEPIPAYFDAAVPHEWFVAPLSVEWDDEEILCVGAMPEGSDADGFREATRARRMGIAREAQARFGRTVSWGVRQGERETLFTTQRVAVAAGLGLRQRAVLDTLVASGLATSREEALSWCVRLVEHHRRPWLDELREALEGTEPSSGRGPVRL